MEIQQIVIFAFLGAVLAVVVTGGLWGMADEEPTSGILGTGAVVGGGLGSLVAYFTDAKIPETKELLQTMTGGAVPDMKVGLPNF